MRSYRGFTLLELLVVISIIGILMAIGVTAFSTAQVRARDARRRADINAMQQAFEQYYADPDGGNGTYATSCTAMLIAPYWNGQAPQDPRSDLSYSCVSDAQSYCSCATLETENDGNATAPTNSGSTCNFAADGSHYCVVNRQ